MPIVVVKGPLLAVRIITAATAATAVAFAVEGKTLFVCTLTPPTCKGKRVAFSPSLSIPGHDPAVP